MPHTLRRIVSFAVLLPAAIAGLTAQQPVYHAVVHPIADPALATLPGGFLMGVDGVRSDFLIAGGGQFVQLPNGNARLTVRTFSQSSVYYAFHVDIEFSGRVAPGDANYPPAGAPVLQLQPSAYAPGGPVDPSTFVYYTAASGKLIGSRDYDGLDLSIASSGPIQVGLGANNVNGHLGLSGNFTVQVLHQMTNPVVPTGPATLTLDLPTERMFFATHPLPDATRSSLVEGRAMVMPGVGDDYVFVPAGEFTEFDDGHALVTGTLARISMLDDAWDATLTFTNRLDPGEVGHPPAARPMLQLLPSAYLGSGGNVDPSHWRYYQLATGTLTGKKLNEGGFVSLFNSGAVQLGSGANQANSYVGYHGVFNAAVVTQPTARTIAITGPVELFSTTAVFPVLPFPELTVPAVPYSLSTLTDQGFVVAGDHLAWTEMIAIGWDIVGFRDSHYWNQGWFKVIDNQHVEIHPRPGAVPGSYPVSAINSIIGSNSVPLTLTAPTAPTMCTEDEVLPYWTQNVLVHSGPVVGPAYAINMISGSLLPSVAPGLVSFDIGNGFTELVIDFTLRSFDAAGIARAQYWNDPSVFVGLPWHWQSFVLDFGDPTLLWGVTNHRTTQY